RCRLRPGPPVAGRDVSFHADDRLDVRLLRFFLEFPGGVEIPVIGDRQGRLLELDGTLDQVIDPVCAIEERVFRVAMEVNEGHIAEDSAPAGSVSKRGTRTNALVSVYTSTNCGTLSACRRATRAPGRRAARHRLSGDCSDRSLPPARRLSRGD